MEDMKPWLKKKTKQQQKTQKYHFMSFGGSNNVFPDVGFLL